MTRQHAARVARDGDGTAVCGVVDDIDGRQPQLRPDSCEIAGCVFIVQAGNEAAIGVFAFVEQKVQEEPFTSPEAASVAALVLTTQNITMRFIQIPRLFCGRWSTYNSSSPHMGTMI